MDQEPRTPPPPVRADIPGRAPFENEPRTSPPREAGTVGPTAPARDATRRRAIWPWLLLVALGVGLFLWRPWAPRHAATEAAAAPSVATATAVTGNFPVVLTELGTVTPLATVTVQSQISGYLTEVAFTEGQEVHRGDLLALIDPRPYEVQLEQYQAQLARDQAALDQAKMDLARYQTLGRQQSIATQTLEDQRYTVAQDQATVKVDQAEIDAQKLNIAYCHVVAPTGGRVGLRQVDAGNYVTPSETNGLVVLTEIKPISVVFTVSEDQIQPILEKLRADRTLEVDAYDRTDTVKLAEGSVETIDNQVDTSTGTVKLRANFPNDDERLFPNEFVNAHLLLSTLHGATLVPTAAVQNGPNGPFVYVVGPLRKPPAHPAGAPAAPATPPEASGRGHRHGAGGTRGATNTVSVRLIHVGDDGHGQTVVRSSLAPGDVVVTDGVDRLKDGADVIVARPATHAAGAARAGGDDATRGATTPDR